MYKQYGCLRRGSSYRIGNSYKGPLLGLLSSRRFYYLQTDLTLTLTILMPAAAPVLMAKAGYKQE